MYYNEDYKLESAPTMSLIYKSLMVLYCTAILSSLPLTTSATFLDSFYDTFFIKGIRITTYRSKSFDATYNLCQMPSRPAYLKDLNKRAKRMPFFSTTYINNKKNCLRISLNVMPGDITLASLLGAYCYWYFKKRNAA